MAAEPLSVPGRVPPYPSIYSISEKKLHQVKHERHSRLRVHAAPDQPGRMLHAKPLVVMARVRLRNPSVVGNIPASNSQSKDDDIFLIDHLPPGTIWCSKRLGS